MGKYVNAVIASDEHITFLSIYSFHAALLAFLQAVASLITTSFLFCHASTLLLLPSIGRRMSCADSAASGKLPARRRYDVFLWRTFLITGGKIRVFPRLRFHHPSHRFHDPRSGRLGSTPTY